MSVPVVRLSTESSSEANGESPDQSSSGSSAGFMMVGLLVLMLSILLCNVFGGSSSASYCRLVTLVVNSSSMASFPVPRGSGTHFSSLSSNESCGMQGTRSLIGISDLSSERCCLAVQLSAHCAFGIPMSTRGSGRREIVSYGHSCSWSRAVESWE